MPTEIAALIDKPLLLALVLAVGAAIGVAAERIVERWKRAERRERWRMRDGKSRWAGGKGRVVPIVQTTVAPRSIRPSCSSTPSAVAIIARAFNTVRMPACSMFIRANSRRVGLTSGRI